MQALGGCEAYLKLCCMDICKHLWLADALTLSPPCLFFAPVLLHVSKPSSSLPVQTRTPFLVALLDALCSALSAVCTSGTAQHTAVDPAALAAVAVEALEKLWHTVTWSHQACYAYVSALCAAVAAESKRLGAEFEHSSSGSTLHAILLKLLDHADSLSSPAAVSRALLLMAMHLPIKRNVETNVACITRLVFDRMCHTQPAGQEGVLDATMLLPALARLGSRSPEAHGMVCTQVKQRLNHELQVSHVTSRASAPAPRIGGTRARLLVRVQEPHDNPALRLFNDVAAATTMTR